MFECLPGFVFSLRNKYISKICIFFHVMSPLLGGGNIG